MTGAEAQTHGSTVPARAMAPVTIASIGWLTLVALCIMLPSFLFGPGATHSHVYNFMWTRAFGAAIAHGDLYPRWLPDSFEGLGSATFYFYPPLAYWISGTFNALGVPVLQAINMAGLLLLLASGITMHVWLSARQTRPMLGAILYMVFPYHLLDFYVRGALAEFAAFVWLPLIALAIERLPHRRGVLLLAVSYGGLCISHLPMAMLTGLFLMAPMLGYRMWRDRGRDSSVILPALVGGALACGLAGFYLVPALTLQNHVSTVLLWSGGYRPSHWSVWAAQWTLLPCMGAVTIIFSLQARSTWTAIAVVTSVAALNLIPILWDMPPLDKAQFSWRALCIAEFAAITAVATCPPRLPLFALGIALLVPPYLHSGRISWGNMTQPVNYAAIARDMPEAPEYLPAGFDLSGITDDYRVAKLTAYRGLPRRDEIIVPRPGRVMLRRAAFPIWRVMHDGHAVPTAGPVISFQAQPGRYVIKRVTIWQETVGWCASLFAMLLLLLVARFGLPRSPRRAFAPAAFASALRYPA
jgi:hypothetical protein